MVFLRRRVTGVCKCCRGARRGLLTQCSGRKEVLGMYLRRSLCAQVRQWAFEEDLRIVVEGVLGQGAEVRVVAPCLRCSSGVEEGQE